MGQTSGSDRNYIYKDKSERYRYMNTFYIFAVVILWVLFGVYLLAKLASKSIAVGTAVGNVVLIILFAVVELAFYLRNKSDVRLKRVVAIGVGVEFALIGMQTDAEFIYFALIAILTLQIPYYDMKRYKQTCIAFSALFTLVEVIRVIKGIGLRDVDSLCRVLCVYLLFFIMYRVGSIAKTFSDHALGSAASEGEKQKVMLEGILDISKTVRDESERSTSLVDELVHTSETVAQSMQEISSATNTTAKNIEEQNNMTQSIQSAIDETGERSRKMVDVATDSNENIQENLQVMEELKNQSEQIAATNHEVTESMTRLQNKTKEVEEIAGMILNISNQTNLLALNASIESARAGEAGRGFAVVAEQIRQLAEQTKKSTEEITTIINELNENARDVMTSVESSVEATESQNEKIAVAAESFERLNENMSQLIGERTGTMYFILSLIGAIPMAVFPAVGGDLYQVVPFPASYPRIFLASLVCTVVGGFLIYSQAAPRMFRGAGEALWNRIRDTKGTTRSMAVAMLRITLTGGFLGLGLAFIFPNEFELLVVEYVMGIFAALLFILTAV